MGRGGSGSNRVNRGGSWNNDASNLRSANRNNDTPSNRNDNLGFRCLSSGHRQEGGGHGFRPRAQGHDHAPRPGAAIRADEEVAPRPSVPLAGLGGRLSPGRRQD